MQDPVEQCMLDCSNSMCQREENPVLGMGCSLDRICILCREGTWDCA